MPVSDGNTYDDMLHINNALQGPAGAAGALVHRRQHGAGMNSSVRRRGRIKKETQ